MEAFLVSAGLVAIAEIGDKTQLLTLALSARYRRPAILILAILVATLLNHAFAALLGQWVRDLLPPGFGGPLIGVSFILIGLWTLIPDSADAAQAGRPPRLGIFMTAAIVFFLAEMGDKTQVATVALAAHHGAPVAVVLGTTLGMMIANVPVVFLGGWLVARLPLAVIRRIAAAFFILFGLVVIFAPGTAG